MCPIDSVGQAWGLVMVQQGADGVRATRAVLLSALDDERFAFPLDAVEEILPAVASAPLAQAPSVIEGIINLRGTPLPLLDLRVRLGRRPRDPDPDDHVVVCCIRDRKVGVWVDRALAVTSIDADTVAPITDVAAANHVEGVALAEDGVYFVYDVRSFLDADESLQLDTAVHAHESDVT